MRGNNILLGLLLVLVAAVAVQQAAGQGLAYVPPGISWPWKQSNASELYKDEPFLKGDAGAFLTFEFAAALAAPGRRSELPIRTRLLHQVHLLIYFSLF